jgi:hypothetical protein
MKRRVSRLVEIGRCQRQARGLVECGPRHGQWPLLAAHLLYLARNVTKDGNGSFKRRIAAWPVS